MKTYHFKQGVSWPVAILIIAAGILIALAAIGMYSSMNSTSIQTPAVAPTPVVAPTAPSPTPSNPVVACGIHVTTPSSTDPQTSPMTISGYVDGQCHWSAFEAQAGTVVVYDSQNTALSAQIPLTISGNWMQTPAYWSVKAGYSMPSTPNGYLLFTNEDASGEHPETYQYPIKFSL